MEAQQTLFTYLRQKLSEKYDVYDGALPPESAPYPFIYLGDCQSVDTIYKDCYGDTIYQTVDVWHNDPKKRGTLSAIIADVKSVCRGMEDNYGWLLTSCSYQILPDNTTSEPLMHGIVNVTIRR